MRLDTVLNRLTHTVRYSLIVGLALVSIGRDSNFGLDVVSRARRFVRGDEFNFLSWTLDTLELKLSQSSLGEHAYLPESERRAIVLNFFQLQDQIARLEGEITDAYAILPEGEQEYAVAPLRQELYALRADQAERQPLAEAIFQDQLAVVLHDEGLTVGGVPVPPVAFHFTPLPLGLVISPRDTIRQDAFIDLRPGFTADDRETLESTIDKTLNVSSFITPIGGIGTYPTMLAETAALNWAAEVGAHEWIHNFLTLRPLGLSYGDSPEMRTVNETVATVAGKELGQALVARFYPDKVPPAESKGSPGAAAPAAPAFDYRTEMHQTRLRVDELLAQGKVEEAEQYMEARRRVFVEQGYSIRKLNQAYFAFYGAYADTPGATGSDPVGPLVLQLRHRSSSLADFLNTVGWIHSYARLQELAAGG